MNKTIIVPADPNEDDCLATAEARFIAEHPELTGWDLSPEFTDDNERDYVTLTVPQWFVDTEEAHKAIQAELDSVTVTDQDGKLCDDYATLLVAVSQDLDGTMPSDGLTVTYASKARTERIFKTHSAIISSLFDLALGGGTIEF